MFRNRLAVLIVLSLAPFAMAQSNHPPSAQENPVTAPQATTPPSTEPTAPAPPSVPNLKGFMLEDGTPIRLKTGRMVSSADSMAGDKVDFVVLEDVSIDGVLVIPKGGPAFATITAAEHKRRMTRGGKLDINIDSVRLVNGDRAPLRAVKEVKGGGHTGVMVGGIVATGILFFPAAPFFLFMHGKDITIPSGTEITAYVSGDMKLDRAKFQPIPLAPLAATDALPSAAPATEQTSNTQLEISSTPDGADIEVDGSFVGSTPSTVGVAAGQHQLVIKKIGFKPWEKTLTVSTGHIKIDATLETESK